MRTTITARRRALPCPLAVLACLAAACAAPEDGFDPHRLLPIESYSAARRLAGPGAELYDLRVAKARPDGALDLGAAYRPKVSYHFVVPRLELAQPVEPAPEPLIGSGQGVEPPLPSRILYQLVDVEADSPRGLERRPGRELEGADRLPPLLPAPDCGLGRLWAAAQRLGAPDNAVADISYGPDGYRFVIEELAYDLRLDSRCAPLGYLRFLVKAPSGTRRPVQLLVDGAEHGELAYDKPIGHVGERQLPFGRHTLTVRLSGVGDLTQSIELAPGPVRLITFQY